MANPKKHAEVPFCSVSGWVRYRSGSVDLRSIADGDPVSRPRFSPERLASLGVGNEEIVSSSDALPVFDIWADHYVKQCTPMAGVGGPQSF